MRYFIYGILLALGIAACSEAVAHEMVPTYPKFEPSHLPEVYVTTLKLFNKRQEIEYYQIDVFDEEWNEIPFVTSYSILKMKYLDTVEFDVYINRSDKDRAEYICSTSKITKQNKTRTAVTSKICSRVK
jgi:hypothetical protein